MMSCDLWQKSSFNVESSSRMECSGKKFKIQLLSFISSFIGISVLSFLNFTYSDPEYTQLGSSDYDPKNTLYAPSGLPSLICFSFGAAAVLYFGQPDSELAQPKNAIIGQLLSATIGVTIHQLFDYMNTGARLRWLEVSLALSLSLLAMQMTDSVHPPGIDY